VELLEKVVAQGLRVQTVLREKQEQVEQAVAQEHLALAVHRVHQVHQALQANQVLLQLLAHQVNQEQVVKAEQAVKAELLERLVHLANLVQVVLMAQTEHQALTVAQEQTAQVVLQA
jgi:hypothetical protein